MVRNNITVFLAVTFFALQFLATPVYHYHEGTSVDVEYVADTPEVPAGGVLEATWSGNIVTACPVELRRTIVDSDNVVTTLTPRVLGTPPADQMGEVEYATQTDIPRRMALGPATYNVVEVPKCNWVQRIVPVSIPYPAVEFTVVE